MLSDMKVMWTSSNEVYCVFISVPVDMRRGRLVGSGPSLN